MDATCSTDFKHGKVQFETGKGYRVPDKAGGFLEGHGILKEIGPDNPYTGKLIEITAEQLDPHATKGAGTDGLDARPPSEKVTLDVHDVGKLSASGLKAGG